MRNLLLTILISFSIGAYSQKKSVIVCEQAPKPVGPYSQAIRSGNTLYVSGQIALRCDGSMDSSSVENETRQVMRNIQNILKTAGMDFNNIVKTTIYLTDLKNYKKVNDTYGSYFTSAPPARETVEVKALPKGARIEISVIAAL